MHTIQRLSTVLLLLFLFVQLKAQKPDSVLMQYSKEYQQEKVYIQFDKPFYNAGDMIWYKAYLLAGIEPSDYSQNFYVDFFGEDGKLLQHCIDPLVESGAKGQFEIPDIYAGKHLFIKAYTKWMLNFDSDFIFHKTIPVIQRTTVFKPASVSQSKLSFFPEGGDLITGLPCRIAFKAVDIQGIPVPVKGAIKTHTGQLIDSFASEHDGMGSLILTTEINETYTANWTDASGTSYTTSLPAAKKVGIALTIKPLAERDIITVQRSNNATDEWKTIHLIAHMNLHPVYSATLNLTSKNTVLSEIATASLPTGILQITLFNANWIPVAERIVFVNNHEYAFQTNVNTLIKGLGKREKNQLEISVTDSAASNLSIAVTDAELKTEDPSSENIFTQLLLSSDLKGTIYHPGYYFSGDDDSIDNHLDLVMLTHGWRRFKWEEIANGKTPVLPYAKETGAMTVQGQIQNISKFKLPADGQKLTMIMQSIDSSQQVFSIPIPTNGNFSLSVNSYYDSLKLYYQFVNNQRLNDKAELSFKTDLLPNPPDYSVTTSSNWLEHSIDTAAMHKSVFFLVEENKIEKDKQSHRLADVIVKATAKKKEELLDEQYASGLFRGSEGIKLDVTSDPKYYLGMTFEQYIINKAPGLRVIHDSVGRPHLTWRGDKTDVYLDEVYVSEDSMSLGLQNIDMNDIGYIKIFPPGSSTGMTNPKHVGGSPGGSVALYSKVGDNRDNTFSSFKLAKLEGYTPYKEFYSPDYSDPPKDFFKDARSTLYWDPFILSNVSGHKIKLEFFNNDYSKKLRVVLEGINSEGRLTRTEKIIE